MFSHILSTFTDRGTYALVFCHINVTLDSLTINATGTCENLYCPKVTSVSFTMHHQLMLHYCNLRHMNTIVHSLVSKFMSMELKLHILFLFSLILFSVALFGRFGDCIFFNRSYFFRSSE